MRNVVASACMFVCLIAIWVMPVEAGPRRKLEIHVWTFDRGNATIFANPDIYGDRRDRHPELVAGESGKQPWAIEFDIDFPVDATYTLHVRYASPAQRPLELWLDGRKLGAYCGRVTGRPPKQSGWPTTYALPEGARRIHGADWEEICKLSVTGGKHTLKFARRGTPPHLRALRLESSAGFPKEWKPPERKVRFDRMAPALHRIFTPPEKVNPATLRMAIEDVMAEYGPRYPDGPKYLERLAALAPRQKAVEDGGPEQIQEVHDALAALQSEAMLAHPLLDFDRLLFVKLKGRERCPIYNSYPQHGDKGSNLCVLSPVAPDGKVTELAPRLGGGLFGQFGLSFDADRAVFAYLKDKKSNYRIYEIGTDGKGLRQVTFDGNEPEFRKRYKGKSVPRKYMHSCGRYIDVDPCYLPNGNIMFASTRAGRSVSCHPSIVTSLHVVDPDGGNMRCLSGGQFTELDPRAMDDGRVIYTRWEYVDKGFANVQSLWSMRPDGSHSDHVFKNNLVMPDALVDPRSIPGSQRIVAVAAPHGGKCAGPVVLVDNRRSKRAPTALTSITPEVEYPGMSRVTRGGSDFRQPYPLSEKLFLVSHDPRSVGYGHYGLYVLDKWGNRTLLYRDPEQSCFQPVPLRPRRRPPRIPPVAPADPGEERTATMFVQDVYRGLTGIERGRVKYVRVMEVMPTTWHEQVTGEGQFYLQEAAVSYKGDVGRKKVHGVAKVHADGSACFPAPARANLFFQALDENYMELQRMRTFINLMPGEKRSCIGCHEPRRNAPAVRRRPLAMSRPVQALAPQPGDRGQRMVHYELDVQPTLDRHCVSCHGGKKPQGGLDLTGKRTELWNRSYENLINKRLISNLNGGPGAANVRDTPPLAFGSHRSKMVERMRKDPCRGKLTREEFIRIVTWIDANAPYYGTHKGKKSLRYKDQPNFRPPPVASR